MAIDGSRHGRRVTVDAMRELGKQVAGKSELAY